MSKTPLKMSKYLPHIAAGLALLLAFAIFQLFTMEKELEGIEESKRRIEQYLERDQVEIINLKEQAEERIETRKEEKRRDSLAIAQLHKIINDFKTTPEYDQEIDRVDSSDTIRIAREFAKYYHNN